jgi:hypothetical protein
MRYVLLIIILSLLSACAAFIAPEQPTQTLEPYHTPMPEPTPNQSSDVDDLIKKAWEEAWLNKDSYVPKRFIYVNDYENEPHIAMFRLGTADFIEFIRYPTEAMLFDEYTQYIIAKISPENDNEIVSFMGLVEEIGDFPVRMGVFESIKLDAEKIAFLSSDEQINAFLQENGVSVSVIKKYVVHQLMEHRLPEVVWVQTDAGDYFITFIVLNILEPEKFHFELLTQEEYIERYVTPVDWDAVWQSNEG